MAFDVGTLRANLELNRSDFEQGLRNARTNLGALDDTAGRTSRSLRQVVMPSSLSTDARAAETQLGRMETAARRSSARIDEIGTSAQGASREVSGMVDAAGEAGSAAGSSGGGNFLSSFSDKIGSLSGKSGPIAGSLIGVAALGLSIGATLASAITDGMTAEADRDLLQAKLGIDEATAQRIGTAAGASYSAGWGESVTGNMDAARAAIQAGLLTGNEDATAIQATIDKLNIVSSIMGEDVPSVARAASQAVKTGFAQDGTSALDAFVKAQQVGLNTSEDFLDTIGEYSTQFRKLGLTGPEAMGLMSQAVKNGARDTDIAADSLKEFSIRAVDGSKTSAEAYDLLGLSAEDMTAKIAKGGDSAKEGLGLVLDRLRETEDPVLRNAAAVGLFGTQAEDLGAALGSMNLSTATSQLGEVAGAAQKAGDTMSSNTASSFETAKRSIETSSTEIKAALADAFGPVLRDLATWVTTHKPELIGFFTGLADAAFGTLIGISKFSAGALRFMADFSEGAVNMLDGVIGSVVTMADKIGGVLKYIPGYQDVGNALQSLSNGYDTLREKTAQNADTARDLADGIDSTLVPGLENMRDRVTTAGESARSSAELMRALGTSVVEGIPNSKTITIDSNSPEQRAALEALGLKVGDLPDGKFSVTSDTAEGQRILDDFIRANAGRRIPMNLTISAGPGGPVDPNLLGFDRSMIPRAERANGARDERPRNATIDPGRGRGLVQWAEAETGWEAYIPGAPSKRPRSTSILQETARRFGYGLVKMADGGITAEGLVGAKSWARSVDPAGYVMGGFSSSALDCSAAVSGFVNTMLGLDAYTSRMSTVTEGAWLAERGAIMGRGGPGTVRIGWFDNGGGANGHTALTMEDGTNFESNGSDGVVVGGPTGADDPMFDQHAYFVVAGAGQGQPSGAAAPSTLTAAGSAGTSTLTGATMPGDSGTRVFVTNWPGSGTEGGPRQPKARVAATFYADGGTVPGYGSGDTHPALLTPGEKVTRKAMAQKYGPLLDAINADRVGWYADGGTVGFGGWSGRKSKDYMAPTNLGEVAALAAGLGFTAVSGLSEYAAMASSGQVDLSKLAPKFDTSSNAIPGLSEAFTTLVKPLEDILQTLKSGGMVEADISVDTSTGNVGLQLTKAGLA